MTKAIKEIIIMLLISLLTMLLLAIVLYKYVPNRKVVPEIVTYKASEDVQDLLEDNIDTKKDSEEVILTYEVTSKDLDNYQKINEYVPGKTNPFAEASTSVTGTVSDEDKSKIEMNGTRTETSSSQNESYFKDTGTK